MASLIDIINQNRGEKTTTPEPKPTFASGSISDIIINTVRKTQPTVQPQEPIQPTKTPIGATRSFEEEPDVITGAQRRAEPPSIGATRSFEPEVLPEQVPIPQLDKDPKIAAIESRFYSIKDPAARAEELRSLPMDKGVDLIGKLPENEQVPIKEELQKLANEDRKRNAFAEGILFSTPIPTFFPKETKEEMAKVAESAPLLSTAGQIAGTVGQAMIGSQLVGGLLAKTPIGKSKLLTDALTRFTVAGGIAAEQNIGRKDIKEAIGDVVQQSGGGLISLIPELVAPPGVAQLIAQPLADLIYDVGAGAYRRQDITSKDWWKSELISLATSMGFAIKDVTSGKTFEIDQQTKIDELTKLFKSDKLEIVPKGETNVPEMQTKTEAEITPAQPTEAPPAPAAAPKPIEVMETEARQAVEGLSPEVAAPATLPERKRGFASEVGGTAKQQVGLSPMATEAAKRAEAKFDKQDAEIKAKFVPTFKQKIRNTIDKIGETVVDRSYYAKRLLGPEGDKVIGEYNAVKGSSAEAKEQYENAEKTISQNLPNELEKRFPRYLQAKRIVEIEGYKGEGKVRHAEGMTLEEARDLVADIENNLPKEQSEAIKVTAQRYWDEMSNQLKQLYDEGIINKASYDNLLENGKNYSPREYIQYIDPDATSGIGQRIGVSESGIKKLDTGSEQAMINNWRLLLSEKVARTQSRIAKNKAARELYNFVKNNPDNDIKATIEEDATKSLPAGTERISYMEGGDKKSIIVPTKFAESWNQNDVIINRSLAKALNLASGAFLVRPLATGVLAPEFALSNIFRDASMQWLTTKEYSKFAPVALAQTGRNMTKVFKDAWTGRGRYRDYIKEGGGMEYLTEQGKMFRDPTKLMTPSVERNKEVYNFLTKLQQFSERLGRLSLREQAIRNGKSPKEATRIAREYLDFSQGGSWTKAIDSAVPYLNASVQGTRSVVRAFQKDPVGTTAKAAQLMIMGAATAYLSNQYRKDSWEDIGDREKVSRWNFPLPFKYKNKEGNEVKSYISIPKDQSARVFATIGEVFADRQLGNINGNQAWRRIQMAIGDINPVDFIGLVPPSLSAVIGYALNKDFWTKEDIWKGRNVSPHMEFYQGGTPEALVDFTQAMSNIGIEISPAKLESGMRQVMPANPVSALMGGAYDQVAASLSGEEKTKLDKTMLQQIAAFPGIRKFLRTTYPRNIDLEQMSKDIKKYKISIKDENGRTKNKRQLNDEIYQAKLKVNDIRQQNDTKLIIISELLKSGNKEEARNKWKELKKEAYKVLGSDEIDRLEKRINRMSK